MKVMSWGQGRVCQKNACQLLWPKGRSCTSSAMNPKSLLPILLWINQIPLPKQDEANDFVH